MVEIGHPVDLNLPAKLQDREYRQQYFLAESSAQIAAQIIALRKRRGLNQQEVAKMVGTRQSAISRVEQADYQNWSFKTLRSIADALDARIRVAIQPSEDVLREYAATRYDQENQTSTSFALPGAPIWKNAQNVAWFSSQIGAFRNLIFSTQAFDQQFLGKATGFTTAEIAGLKQENNRIKEENKRLRTALLMCAPGKQGRLPQGAEDALGNPVIQTTPQIALNPVA
jgi:transcriptional regulator with XRE-family HTH domain